MAHTEKRSPVDDGSRAAWDNDVFCEGFPGLISAPVASVRSARCGSGGAVVEVEVEMGATAEGVGSGTTVCGESRGCN